MEEELFVELIDKTEGKFECALVNEEGEERYKFSLELSNEDLIEMTENIIYREQITREALEKDLKEEIIAQIMEECSEYDPFINYEDLHRYDNMAAGDIASSLSDWIENRVYDYFNNIYHLNDGQLKEMKKFYHENIDLNLAIKRKQKSFISGSEMLSTEEMKKIRLSKEEEWRNMVGGERKSSKTFKEGLKEEMPPIQDIQQSNNGISVDNETEIEIGYP